MSSYIHVIVTVIASIYTNHWTKRPCMYYRVYVFSFFGGPIHTHTQTDQNNTSFIQHSWCSAQVNIFWRIGDISQWTYILEYVLSLWLSFRCSVTRRVMSERSTERLYASCDAAIERSSFPTISASQRQSQTQVRAVTTELARICNG